MRFVNSPIARLVYSTGLFLALAGQAAAVTVTVQVHLGDKDTKGALVAAPAISPGTTVGFAKITSTSPSVANYVSPDQHGRFADSLLTRGTVGVLQITAHGNSDVTLAIHNQNSFGWKDCRFRVVYSPSTGIQIKDMEQNHMHPGMAIVGSTVTVQLPNPLKLF